LAAYLMGGQTRPYDVHLSTYDESGLRAMLRQAGFVCIRRIKSSRKDASSLPVSLCMEAYRPTATALNAPGRKKIGAVMSTGRLGFNDNMFCALSAFSSMSIRLHKHTSAFWGRSMAKAIQLSIDDNVDYVLTLDYDTTFSEDTVRRLIMLMETYPEADAIAPLQMKREENSVLMYKGEPLTVEDFDADLVPVDTAHFGLTIIKASVFEKLKKPWFFPIEDEDGTWGDDDIYFWRNFQSCGFKLFTAGRVSVGHLQLMNTWPSEQMTPHFQYVSHYQKNGMPAQARQ